MGRRRGSDTDFADIEFLFRFIHMPFKSEGWAVSYMLIGLVLSFVTWYFAPSPAQPGTLDFSQVYGVFFLRLEIPALAFMLVGILGGCTCLVRDLYERLTD